MAAVVAASEGEGGDGEGSGGVDGVEEGLVLRHILDALADVPVANRRSGGGRVHVEAAGVHLHAYARDALDPDAHPGQGRALAPVDAVLACRRREEGEGAELAGKRATDTIGGNDESSRG